MRANPPASNPSFLVTAFGAQAQIGLPVGNYNVTLRVSDGTGLSSVASQTFVVGAGRADGLIAVIAQPNPWVPGPAGGGQATVSLDAAGTQPSPGNRLTQWVWAVITLPDKTPITNTTGPVATAALPPGDYQVGLLAIDSAGDNAIAKKNFTVGGRGGGGAGGAGGGGGGAGGNAPPQIPPGLVVTGSSGATAVIPGISDPNGDAVSLEWVIDPDDLAIPGQGTAVSLRGVPPGEYTLQITARDDRGATSTARATLRVQPAGGGAGGASPPPPDEGGLSLRLPSLTLGAGSNVVLNAGATGVPLDELADYTYTWTLTQKATGSRVDGQSGPTARFSLARPDTYQLQLQAAPKAGGGGGGGSGGGTATSNVRVLARSGPPLPVLAAGSKCGPFTSPAGGDVRLACPDLKVTDDKGAPYTNVTFAWRVTNIDSGAVKTGIGREFGAGK